MADPGAGGVVRREAGGSPGPLCGFLCVCCAPFIIGPPVNMLDSKGGHRQQGGRKEGGGCSRGASSVIFNTSGAAKKTDKDKQNDGRGGINKNKGTRF